ncbi:MAG: glycosyltransferase family 4 protein [Saccharofermentanales bacterium]
MKNILVVCQYYYPEDFRINDICEKLVDQGEQVTVLTGLPNYPSGKIPAEYRLWRKRKETINGVRVIRTWEIGRKPTKWGLLFNYGSFMLSGSIKAIFMSGDFDSVIVYQLSPISMAFPAVVYSKVHHKKLNLYCFDLWPESLKAKNIAEYSRMFRTVDRFSKFIYKQCDTIAVTSESFISYLNSKHGIPKEKITVISQHASELDPYNNDNEIPNADVNILFAGNIGMVQDLECVINAVEKIETTKNYLVHIVGDGSNLEACMNIVNEKKLQDRIIFHGRHPMKEMSKFYSIANACLITMKDDSAIGDTIPSKLQRYMCEGKPVLGAASGAIKQLIDDSQCGICVESGNCDELSMVIEKYIDQPHKYIHYGMNGRKYYEEHYTPEIFMKKFEELFINQNLSENKMQKNKNVNNE